MCQISTAEVLATAGLKTRGYEGSAGV